MFSCFHTIVVKVLDEYSSVRHVVVVGGVPVESRCVVC